MQTVLKLHTLKLIIQNVHVFFWHSCRSGFKTGEQNGAREKSCSPQPMSDIEQCRQFHPRGQISFQTSSAHGRQLGVLNHQRQHNLQLPSALLPPSLFPPSPSPSHFLHLSTPLSLPQNPLMNPVKSIPEGRSNLQPLHWTSLTLKNDLIGLQSSKHWHEIINECV